MVTAVRAAEETSKAEKQRWELRLAWFQPVRVLSALGPCGPHRPGVAGLSPEAPGERDCVVPGSPRPVPHPPSFHLSSHALLHVVLAAL